MHLHGPYGSIDSISQGGPFGSIPTGNTINLVRADGVKPATGVHTAPIDGETTDIPVNARRQTETVIPIAWGLS